MKTFIKVIFLIAVLISANSSFSQIKQEDPFEKMLGKTQEMPTSRINADAPQLFGSITDANVYDQLVPLEGVVNADQYIVGPNDLFNLGVYGFINQQVPIYVTPEGTVVIPTVGEVDVSDLTLREAKSKVVSKVKERYYSSEVSFTLAQPRVFLVKVSGLIQGNFEVYPTSRPSDLLKRLFFDTTNVSRVAYETTNVREHLITELSLRNIELIRKNGTIQRVDVYKFFMTNDDEYNPYFNEGDLLKIPNLLLEKNYVTVSGAVQLGGTYEYSPGDDLETLVGLGRGFDANAEPDSILLYRPSNNVKGFDIINLDYDDDKNYKIQNFDRIFVKYKTDYFKKVTVLILGEVKRPGYYPIAFKKTKVKDAIEIAGGLTNEAYLPLSILFRHYDQEYTAKDTVEILINQRGNDLIVTEMDKENFWYDITSRRNRVVVNFEKLINKNDETQNVLLEDKDVIYINDNKNIVYVYGQVGNEGYVPFKKGEDAEYYVEQAGGYSLAADEGNTRIIKFNSRGWYEPGDIEVESGDYIYVPKETKTEFKDWVTLISQFSGILVGLLTIYLLIKQAEK